MTRRGLLAGSVGRRPAAESDLIEVWAYIARENTSAADSALDRIERVLRMLADNPLIGRARPELGSGLRSFTIGSRVAFYRVTGEGIDLVRVLGGAMDIRPDDIV